jgi:probable HAF family extracellular repeat protein
MTRRLSTSWIGVALTVGLRAAAATVQNDRLSHVSMTRRTGRAVFAFAVAVMTVMFAAPTTAAAQSCVGTIGPCFQGLGFLNPSNPFSAPMGISPDGSVVVGFSTDVNGNYQAFKWSAGTMTGLGYINPSCPSTSFTCNSVATGVNSLGTVVGYSPVAAGNNEAFSWSAGTMTGLGYLFPGFPNSLANAIASQANVAVGVSAPNPATPNLSDNEAVSFQNGVVTGLGFLQTMSLAASFANGMNSSGQVIVGNSIYTTSGSQQQEAFSWQNGVMTGLGFVPSGVASRAFAANASGSVIVGDSATSSTDVAVRWVNGTIAALGGGVGGGGPAYNVSANGNVVVGLGLNGGVANGPFRWTPVDGMQKIQSLLIAAGVNITGWSLGYVQTPVADTIPGVSANGTTITGFGIDPNGHSQAWIARLPAPGAPLADTHDFNADGMSDIAWRDSSGNVAVWLMNGNQLLQGGGLGNADPNVWKIVGQRDFNGDGKADLLWNDTSGNVAIWLMNGVQVLQYASGPSAPGWTVVGTGDFNGDGKGDILLENAGGNLAVWLMNGAQVSQAGGIGTLPSGWKVVGTGDFNGDGKADILFENASGVLAIWFMNGVQVSQLGNPPAATAAWTVVGTGDFNGDGFSDILWRDSSNNLAVWLMQSTSILQAGSLGNVGTTWNVAETGDFNGDGKSDILWRDTSGNVAMWYMNGTAVLQSLGAGAAPLTWTIQGSNAD